MRAFTPQAVGLLRTRRLLRAPKAAGGGAGTFTLFPVVQSGYVASSGSDIDSARAGTGFGFSPSPSATMVVGEDDQADSYGTTYDVYESFLSFDTSGVTGTVSTATLSLGLIFDNSANDFTVQARAKDWGGSLEGADFVVTGGFGALTLLATLATAGIGANGYKAMTENGSNLRAAINQSGFTRILLVADRTANATAYNYGAISLDPYNGATKSKLVVVTT